MALSSAPADGASSIKLCFNGLPSMCQFRREHDFPGSIVDNREPGGLRARIDLDPQWLYHWRLHGPFEDDRERVSLPHGSFAGRE